MSIINYYLSVIGGDCHLAVELALVLAAERAVQQLVAQAALEARLDRGDDDDNNDDDDDNSNDDNDNTTLCHLKPPAIFSSAAYTVLLHTGQLLGISELLLTSCMLELEL